MPAADGPRFPPPKGTPKPAAFRAEMLALRRPGDDPLAARAALMEKYGLTVEQACDLLFRAKFDYVADTRAYLTDIKREAAKKAAAKIKKDTA